MSLIVPAVLPSSRRDLEEKLALFASFPSVTRVQIDVVDGRFAFPQSWPYIAPSELQYVIDSGYMLPNLDRISYEIDLMCTNAESMAEAWLALGATRLTFHAESTTNLTRLLTSVREHYGSGAGFASNLISFGLALNVASDLALLSPHLAEVSYVQCMGIARIGHQGEPFDERVLEKVRVLHEKYPDIPIQVDGGVSLESAKKLTALGVSTLIVGSAILRAKDPKTAFAEFEGLEGPYGV